MNPAWKELFIDAKSLRQRQIQIQQSVAASFIKGVKISPKSLTQQSLPKSYQAARGVFLIQKQVP